MALERRFDFRMSAKRTFGRGDTEICMCINNGPDSLFSLLLLLLLVCYGVLGISS